MHRTAIGFVHERLMAGCAVRALGPGTIRAGCGDERHSSTARPSGNLSQKTVRITAKPKRGGGRGSD